MCYKIELIIEERRKGRIENQRIRSNFFVSLLIGRVLFIDTTCNP